jgi:REP element-mobilizing transposase RayT
MNGFGKRSHSIWECKCYSMFRHEYRYGIFQDQTGENGRQKIYHLLQRTDLFDVQEINVQPGNVHSILSAPLNCAISYIMGFLKGQIVS